MKRRGEKSKVLYNWIDLRSILTTPAYLKKAAEFYAEDRPSWAISGD